MDRIRVKRCLHNKIRLLWSKVFFRLLQTLLFFEPSHFFTFLTFYNYFKIWSLRWNLGIRSINPFSTIIQHKICIMHASIYMYVYFWKLILVFTFSFWPIIKYHVFEDNQIAKLILSFYICVLPRHSLEKACNGNRCTNYQ